MTIFTVNSKRDNIQKARIVLEERARNAGCVEFGEITREVNEQAEDGKIYKFSMEAS